MVNQEIIQVFWGLLIMLLFQIFLFIWERFDSTVISDPW